MFQKRPLRRTQLISPWGIGQMINFPGDESLMVCSLDAWESTYQDAPDSYSEFVFHEERLERRLHVSEFRFPPDYRESGIGVQNPHLKIPCIRFPQWHYCPKCGFMKKLSLYGSRCRCEGPNYPGLSCHTTKPNKRSFLIPVRFIAICEKGHIEDFPFMEWVHKGGAYDNDCQLRLQSGRSSSSLAGIKITCTCGAYRTLAGAFNKDSLESIRKRCGGYRPWLGEIDDKARYCGEPLRVVQRGASNVYFSEIRSSIYLPRWEKTIHRKIIEVLDNNWDVLVRNRVDGQLNRIVFETIAELKGVDCEQLLAAAEKRLSETSTDGSQIEDSEELYRTSEYEAIIAELGGDNQDFFVTNKKSVEYGDIVQQFFKSISLIHKLRETRALVGFSRWRPEDGRSLQAKRADLALSNSFRWLPAIIVRGEGLFFEFRTDKLDEWLENADVLKRAEKQIENFNNARIRRGQTIRRLNPRFILIHTFAHILINQLSFECGYGSSSLRERIYCNCEHDKPMNGVLIYTASGDSEGSLGGLVRQGKPGNIEDILISALHKAQWCSSDPVCIQSQGQGPDSCNHAACHSCALLPETSCEEGNRLLDRALLIGTLERPEIGYFSEIK